MRTAIYGAGALGTILGAYMSRAGLDVDLVSRNKAHVEGLKANGARVIGTVTMTETVKALLPEEMTDLYDLIILLTKQTENDSVVRSLQGFLGDSGVICTLQNGIPEYQIAGIIGEDRTFGGAVGWGATMVGGGVCELTSDPHNLNFSIGQFGPRNNEMLGRIKDVLETMGPVTIEDNFIGARWSKLLINSTFSGLSTVLGCSFGKAAANPRSRKYAQLIMKECIDVSRAAGVTIEPVQGKDIVRLFDYRGGFKKWISRLLIPMAIRRHRRLKPSLLQDIERGRKTEIDYINGIVADSGRSQGVPTPVNSLIVQLIHKMEAGELSPGFDNLQAFEELTGS